MLDATEAEDQIDRLLWQRFTSNSLSLRLRSLSRLVPRVPFVATCEARNLIPFAYLADVIARVQVHPQCGFDKLLRGP